jgi:hypothetical protein
MVVPPKKFCHLLDSWMAHMGYIMCQSDQLGAKANIARHNDPLSGIMQKPILHVPSFLKVWERAKCCKHSKKLGTDSDTATLTKWTSRSSTTSLVSLEALT